MTEYNRVFVDTAPLIYFLENDANFGETSKTVFTEILSTGKHLITSAVTCEEYLVHPYKTGDSESAEAFFEFIEDCHLQVSPITIDVAKKAARLRAKYKDVKGMDALQLASAITNNCDLFLTNDRQLRQIEEIKCVMLEEWQ